MLTKTYNDISVEPIDEAKFIIPTFHILALGYIEKGVSRFTQLTTENKNKGENEDD